jgi:hypothetical protein
LNYLIPKNVKQRFEFFPGMGFKELFMIIGGLVAGFLIFSFLGYFTPSFVRIIAVALTTSIGFFIGKADPRSSKTVLNLIMDAKVWRLSQRRFLYIYGRGGSFADTRSKAQMDKAKAGCEIRGRN